MAIEGVNSNSAIIQGTQTNNIAQQNKAIEADKAGNNELSANSVGDNTGQDDANTSSTGVNQDSETINAHNEPGALLDVLA